MRGAFNPSAEQARVEKAIQERNVLYRRYRAAKRTELQELCAASEHGERLRKFAATLNHFGIEHAARMKAYVQDEADQWLGSAPADIRAMALSLIDHRIIRIRQRAGLVPFDDPLPSEPDRIFQTLKRMLAV